MIQSKGDFTVKVARSSDHVVVAPDSAMAGRMFARARGDKTLEDTLDAVGGFREGGDIAKGSAFNRYTEACRRIGAVDAGFTRIARENFGIEKHVAPPRVASANVAAGSDGKLGVVLSGYVRNYIGAVAKSVRECPCFGKLETLGPHEARISFIDARHKRGWLVHEYHRDGHQHDLIETSYRRLGEVALPPHVLTVAETMPEIAWPYMHVLTGKLIVEGRFDGGSERHETALARGLRAVGRGAVAIAPVATLVAGVAAGSAALVGLGAMALPLIPLLMVGAVADPGLVLGDVVLGGWIESQKETK